MSATFRQPTIWLIAAVALLLIGCRGNLDVEVAKSPLPRATSTATPRPMPTPPPFRMDCDAIESSEVFIHMAEQDWFIANCQTGPQVLLSYDERLGIGKRVMEFFTVDTTICETGLLSFTVLHEPDLERFSYQFRNFCSDFDPVTLEFPPPPFLCPDSGVIEVVEVALTFIIDFVRYETEVICISAENPAQRNSETSTDGSQPEWS